MAYLNKLAKDKDFYTRKNGHHYNEEHNLMDPVAYILRI